MFNIWQGKQNVFGLDISDQSIKVMQLAKSGGSYKVAGFLKHPLQKGIMVSDVIINEAALVNNIVNILRHPDYGKIRGEHVVASVPESKSFVRIIEIPKMTEEQAVNAVPFEAEQFIPIPLDQAYLDWQIIGESDGKMQVLVTAAAREYIDPYLKVLKAAGLKPLAFEVESAALARSLIGSNQAPKSLLIADLDAYRSSLIVMDKGHLQFSSSVPIAGDALTQGIVRALGLSFEEAEKIKKSIGMDEGKEHQNIRGALAAVVDSLIAEIRNVIKFHDEHSDMAISQIILCGGTAKISHLSSYMYNKLADMNNIDIILGNPWINLTDKKRGVPTMLSREDSLSYATVIGLAIRAAGGK